MSETNGASRAGLYLSIAASLAFLLGAVGSMFYVAFKAQSNTDALAAQTMIVSGLIGRIGQLEDRQTKTEVAANEIETQFCAMDIVRNLMHANDLRNTSLLWQKTFGTEYPIDNAFYPTICNRKPRQ